LSAGDVGRDTGPSLQPPSTVASAKISGITRDRTCINPKIMVKRRGRVKQDAGEGELVLASLIKRRGWRSRAKMSTGETTGGLQERETMGVKQTQ
jgi:hypothetical protein